MAGNYCLVENGAVTDGPRGLPKSWKNTSGMHHATDAELKVMGWLPFVEVDPPYDAAVYWRDTPTVDIQADQVVYNQVLVAYTAQQLKQNAWNDWISLMAQGDNDLPRYAEDMMDALLAKHSDAYDDFSELKKKNADKKSARGLKP